MIWVGLAWGLELPAVRAQVTEQAIAVAVADAQHRRAKGQTWNAASGSLPQIELFATGSLGSGLTSFGFERPVRSQLGLGVTGQWVLIDPGGWAAATAAGHTAKGAGALLDWTRVQARRDATVAYANLWATRGSLDAWEQAAVDAAKAAEGVRSLVDTGLRPKADGARSDATAATLQAEARRAEGELQAACASLQALLRVEVTGRCDVVDPGALEPGQAPEEHPALVAAEQALAAAKASRASALLDRGPTVAATGTVGQYYAGENSGLGWSAGVDARMPLISGGAGLGSNQVAAAAKDEAELALERQRLDLQAATVAADARYRAARSTLEARTTAAAATEDALVLVEARYREGLEGLETWLSARRDRDQARVELAVARGALLQALAELEAVRGVQ